MRGELLRYLEYNRDPNAPDLQGTANIGPRRALRRLLRKGKLLTSQRRARLADYARYLHRCERTPLPARERSTGQKMSQWSPTPLRIAVRALKLAKVGPNDTVFDLGCGDGRVVVEAARRFGAKAVGFDIDLRQLRNARAKVRSAHLDRMVEVRRQSMLAIPDLYKATVIYLYLPQRAVSRVIPVLARWCPNRRAS